MTENRNLIIMSVTTVANAATIYSTSYNGEYASGFRSVLIEMVGSSNVTITEQASVDGTNFYDPVTSTGSALGAVCSALTSTVGVYVQFAPVFARHNRLKVVAGAASTVTLTLTTSEQTP